MRSPAARARRRAQRLEVIDGRLYTAFRVLPGAKDVQVLEVLHQSAGGLIGGPVEAHLISGIVSEDAGFRMEQPARESASWVETDCDGELCWTCSPSIPVDRSAQMAVSAMLTSHELRRRGEPHRGQAEATGGSASMPDESRRETYTVTIGAPPRGSQSASHLRQNAYHKAPASDRKTACR